jgi:hypothetical protein
MANMIVGYLVLGVLGLLGLPLARMRDILVGFVHRALQVTYLAMLSLFGYFGSRPDMAPQQLTTFLRPLTSWLVGLLPDGVAIESPGIVWILNAVAFAIPSVPILLLAYFLKQITHDTRLRKRARREGNSALVDGVRSTSEARLNQAFERPIAPRASEMQAAIDAMRGADKNVPSVLRRPRKLVCDLVTNIR